jgi:hypothetical protein
MHHTDQCPSNSCFTPIESASRPGPYASLLDSCVTDAAAHAAAAAGGAAVGAPLAPAKQQPSSSPLGGSADSTTAGRLQIASILANLQEAHTADAAPVSI